MHRLISFFILLLLVSCSGGGLDWGPREEITESFEIPEETKQRFVVKPIENQSEESKSTEAVTNESSSAVVEEKVKKVAKAETPKKKEPGRTKKVMPRPEVVSYPKDYPDKYKKWDEKNRFLWDSFHFNSPIGEVSSLRIRYLGLPVGTLKLSVLSQVEVDGKIALHLNARLKTDSYYAMLYELDETLDSYVEFEEFLPLKYELVRREKKKNVDDMQLFDRRNLEIRHFYKKVQKKDDRVHKKQQTIVMPRLIQDPLSSIIFLRGLPLNDKDVYSFPVGNKSKLYMSTARVSGREEVKVMGERVMAIKVSATNSLSGSDEKKGEMIFWFEDNKSRRLLKMSGDIKIGHIEGELVDYQL